MAITSARQPLVDELTVRQSGAIAHALSGLVNLRIEAQQLVLFEELKEATRADPDRLETVELAAAIAYIDPGNFATNITAGVPLWVRTSHSVSHKPPDRAIRTKKSASGNAMLKPPEKDWMSPTPGTQGTACAYLESAPEEQAHLPSRGDRGDGDLMRLPMCVTSSTGATE